MIFFARDDLKELSCIIIKKLIHESQRIGARVIKILSYTFDKFLNRRAFGCLENCVHFEKFTLLKQHLTATPWFGSQCHLVEFGVIIHSHHQTNARLTHRNVVSYCCYILPCMKTSLVHNTVYTKSHIRCFSDSFWCVLTPSSGSPVNCKFLTTHQMIIST